MKKFIALQTKEKLPGMNLYSNNKIAYENMIFKIYNIIKPPSITQFLNKVNQFAGVIDHAGNITNFTKNLAYKRLKRDLSLNFCDKKSKIMN